MTHDGSKDDSQNPPQVILPRRPIGSYVPDDLDGFDEMLSEALNELDSSEND